MKEDIVSKVTSMLNNCAHAHIKNKGGREMKTYANKRQEKWRATGSYVVSSDGNAVIIEIPVINPVTGKEQMTPAEAYNLAMFIKNALNDLEEKEPASYLTKPLLEKVRRTS